MKVIMIQCNLHLYEVQSINQSMTLLTCQRYLAEGEYPSTNWGHLPVIKK